VARGGDAVTAAAANQHTPKIEWSFRIGKAMDQLAALAPSLKSVFSWILYDIVSHHRLSVMKHNKMPGRREAQKMLATRLFRYVSIGHQSGGRMDDMDEHDDIYAESFVAAETGEMYTKNKKFFQILEQGGSVVASGFMAIPIQALAVRGLSARASGLNRLRQGLADRRFAIVNSSRSSGLLVDDDPTNKSVLMGVLRTRLQIKPMLNFNAQWEKVLARNVPRLERGLHRAMTAAGRASLLNDAARRELGLRAFRNKLAELRKAGYGNRANMQKIAHIARLEAEKDAIAGAGGDGKKAVL